MVQVAASAARLTSAGLAVASARMALRRRLASAVCSATNSARVIGVAAATTLKRNGMNKMAHLSGTAFFGSLNNSTTSLKAPVGLSEVRPPPSTSALAMSGRAS